MFRFPILILALFIYELTNRNNIIWDFSEFAHAVRDFPTVVFCRVAGMLAVLGLGAFVVAAGFGIAGLVLLSRNR